MRFRGSRAGIVGLALTGLAAAGPAPSTRWLDVPSVELRSRSVRVTVRNQSKRPLHGIDPRRWGLANYIKVGFDVVPLGRASGEGLWLDQRPDLDGASSSIAWAKIDDQIGHDLDPGESSQIDLELPADPGRGHLELVVLSRLGTSWLLYRRTLSTRVLVPDDALPMLVFSLVFLLAARSWVRRRGRPAGAPRMPAQRLAVLAALVSFGLATAIYALAAWVRAAPIYRYLKNPVGRHQTPGLVVSDPELGFRPAPGATGIYDFPNRFSTTQSFSTDSFREPVLLDRAPGAVDRGSLLALGDSFSLGDACEAEDCYPWRVARGADLSRVYNASFSSYGLAQMLLRGERWIPERKPRVVLAQYSDWLLSRAVSPFAPTTMGVLTAPYFTDDRGGVRIAPPIFESPIYELKPGLFHGTPDDLRDRARFFFGFALPYHLALDLRVGRDLVRQALGLRPLPTRDGLAVVRHVYGLLSSHARAAGATFVIVLLSENRPGPSEETRSALASLPGVVLVDAEARLKDAAASANQKEPDRAYARMFGVWAGTPPRLVDMHPNAEANRLIAESILSALRPAPPRSPPVPPRAPKAPKKPSPKAKHGAPAPRA